MGASIWTPGNAATIAQYAINVKDYPYLAKGDGVTDDTAAIQAAIDAYPGGGIIFIPAGRYRLTDELVLHSGLTIFGQTNVDPYYGLRTGDEAPAMLFQETANKAVFLLGTGVSDLQIYQLSLSSRIDPSAYTLPVAGKYGIKCIGDRPYSSYRIEFTRCTFYNFERAISIVGIDTGAGVDWQCDAVLVERCLFLNNTYGAYFDTTNADAWVFRLCTSLIAQNGAWLYLNRSGYITVDTCYGGPSVLTSAPTYATGNSFIFISDFYDNIEIRNSQAETIDYFLDVDTTVGFENTYNNIVLEDCEIEVPCRVRRKAKIISRGSRYTEDFTCSGNDIEVHSIDDSWEPTTKKFVMSGLRPRLFVAPGSTQTSGTTSALNATATTIATLPASLGSYEVVAAISGSGTNYMSSAKLMCDGTTLIRRGGDNGSGLTITISGRDVQVTQNSGVTQTVSWSYNRLS